MPNHRCGKLNVSRTGLTRFELVMREPKSRALPLGDSPKIWRIFPALFCAARKCLISPLGTFLCLPREKAICTESTTLLHVSSMVSTISIATLASYRVSHSSFFVLLQVLQSQIQETALLSLSLE